MRVEIRWPLASSATPLAPLCANVLLNCSSKAPGAADAICEQEKKASAKSILENFLIFIIATYI
jgi:hypothetical protein